MTFIQFLIILLLCELIVVGICNSYPGQNRGFTPVEEYPSETYNSEKYNITPIVNISPVFNAIMQVECPPWADPYKEGPNGELGILQITPILVEDVNEFLGEEYYTLDDRLDPEKSTEMFLQYYKKYTYGTSKDCAKVIARRWNGGPDGDTQDCTLGYWIKVKEAMNE